MYLVINVETQIVSFYIEYKKFCMLLDCSIAICGESIIHYAMVIRIAKSYISLIYYVSSCTYKYLHILPSIQNPAFQYTIRTKNRYTNRLEIFYDFKHEQLSMVSVIKAIRKVFVAVPILCK